MRFPLETREAIYASGGKPIEIDWPEGRVLPEPHRTYTVQSSRQAGRLRILVMASLDNGLRARVRVAGDPVRILGKSGGYTSRPAHALGARVAPDPENSLQFRSEFEPEALGATEMSDLARRTRRERIERTRAKLGDLYEQLAELQDDPDFSHHKSDVKFLRSLTQKLERQLAKEDIHYLDDLEEAQ